ncbi:UPF0182 protein [Aliidongia dinghuensis]|uniref:UPF0182 protein GCM10011611_56570 n=1 Tax=Aliidongia dinghuensis TaxID=1867774 RepID=A0A8J3E6C5_9PROT|nr:UPF0182 family protein [Aliidongia dinghuensis]GGF42847.1 UPF0182 protein [Aliidongia dinghuensis]
MRRRPLAVASIVILVCLVTLGRVGDFLVDWIWFSSIGYPDVFWTVFKAKAALGAATFLGSGLSLWASGVLALRFARRPAPLPPAFGVGSAAVPLLPGLFRRADPRFAWRFLIAAAAVIPGAFIAAGETGNWDLALRFIAQAPYGQSDPLFNTDIGFYLFSLPAYVALRNWMLITLFASTLVAGLVYWAHGDVVIAAQSRWISPAAIAHGSVLLGLFFVVKAWSYVLDRFLLLYGDNGVVVGAGYTDIHVGLPVLWALVAVASVAALLSWANLRRRTFRLPLTAVVLVFGSSFVLSLVCPALFQRIYVKPNELQLEAPYIGQNIALTQEAYNLRQIAVKPFPAELGLSYQSIQDNGATIDNIRLWDWQPLVDTYAQLQEIRTYYKFRDMEVDRYEIGGSYQQVMLSARELEPALLPPNAHTWVNLHLLFTHGIGVVMSPVTQKSAEGLPTLYLKDIPPVASLGPAIRQPRIYFGQASDSYVIVKASTPEFDYPKGVDNAYTTYDGSDGITLAGAARRTLFAWYFGDTNILLSNYVTDESRILFRRNIQDRVRVIAPFLRLDRDPYVVVSGGRLFWIQDTYTTSDWFPYARPAPEETANYIRNSVKVVIDAYNGSVAFYVADPSDPIVATYRRIFPGLFKPLEAMPPDLQRHIRYPEDLFLMQARMYRAYHMDAPEVFYNREDLWQFPREPNISEHATMAPYYAIMRLPGEARAQFFLMLPMVPNQRQNMIAWLAARCDPPDYGKLIVYEFPKDKLVYGPFQIEARINQNTEISQQITLWNQSGSRVIRGNLLVIPIANSVLYVTPLYLRAETGQLPELKRVIAAYGERVVMEETLSAALASLFKESAIGELSPVRPGPMTPGPMTPSPMTRGPITPGSMTPGRPSPAGPGDDRARAALRHYDLAIERLKAGDWSGFGAELEALRALLEALSQPAPLVSKERTQPPTATDDGLRPQP